MFGLVIPLVLFQFLREPEKDQEPEASVSKLQRVAAQCQFHKDDCVISCEPRSSTLMDSEFEDPTEIYGIYNMNQEYTTIIPQARNSHKRD